MKTEEQVKRLVEGGYDDQSISTILGLPITKVVTLKQGAKPQSTSLNTCPKCGKKLFNDECYACPKKPKLS